MFMLWTTMISAHVRNNGIESVVKCSMKCLKEKTMLLLCVKLNCMATQLLLIYLKLLNLTLKLFYVWLGVSLQNDKLRVLVGMNV